jgi:hypothetical protein
VSPETVTVDGYGADGPEVVVGAPAGIVIVPSALQKMLPTSLIVRTEGLLAPIVAPPVGDDNVRLTVSGPSDVFASVHRGTLNVLFAPSVVAQFKVPAVVT